MIPVLLSLALAAPAGDGLPLAFDAAGAHDLTLRPEGGGFVLNTTGPDPFVLLRPLDAAALPAGATVLAFEYLCPQGVDDFTVYYGPPFAADRTAPAGPLPKAEGWIPFAVDLTAASDGGWTPDLDRLRLDFGRRAGVTVAVRNLRLRPKTGGELRSEAQRRAVREAKLRDEAAIAAYLAAEFPSAIETVTVEPDAVRVVGRSDRPAALLELQPWTPATLHVGGDGVRVVAALPAGPFDLRLPRVEGGTDRVTSRWAVAVKVAVAAGDGWDLRSPAASPATIAARHDLDRTVPRSVKGLGGFTDRGPLSDLTKLGIHNVTLNVPLHLFVRLKPGPEGVPFEHAGRTWYASAAALRKYDALIEHATDRGIVVTAILLVRFSEAPFGRRLVHPEADAGHFAMPNVATAEGVAAFGAAVSLLSERYATPDDRHGRIANWIVGNEIDYGPQWTNMGEQPPLRYLDAYRRALRLVHDLTRRNDPHARAFVSLTHGWDVPPDPRWRVDSPKRMLETLAAFGRLEGDYEWGVAYHPYPENLLAPTPWADPSPTDADDTPLITTRNLPVLQRFLERPELRFRGAVRGVLLSEQGFHTPDDSTASEQTQAAAFLYTWDRLPTAPAVEAFHVHRWVDSLGEGPLRLGLRRLPSEPVPDGARKLAWWVYRDLGTPAAANWRWLLGKAGVPEVP